MASHGNATSVKNAFSEDGHVRRSPGAGREPLGCQVLARLYEQERAGRELHRQPVGQMKNGFFVEPCRCTPFIAASNRIQCAIPPHADDNKWLF